MCPDRDEYVCEYELQYVCLNTSISVQQGPTFISFHLITNDFALLYFLARLNIHDHCSLSYLKSLYGYQHVDPWVE